MNEIPTPIELKIAQVTGAVNTALKSNSFINRLPHDLEGSQMSTKLAEVGEAINPDSLYGMCGTLCEALHAELLKLGVRVEKMYSEDPDGNGHVYLSTKDEQPIIVDPSIGQFLDGLNNVYVGTREQLKEMVVGSMREKIINTRSKGNPKEAFKRIWGNVGKKAY